MANNQAIPDSIPGGALLKMDFDHETPDEIAKVKRAGLKLAEKMEFRRVCKLLAAEYFRERKKLLQAERSIQRKTESPKLTTEQKRAIKELPGEQREIAVELLTGSLTKREIAERFGLELAEVRAIAARLAGQGESKGNRAQGAA